MQFDYLADHPQRVPQVIAWWHTIWADRMGPDIDALERQLLASLNKEQLPIHILAMKEDRPIGTAVLKLQELAELFPDKQFWLGSVFVDVPHRGEKIASALTRQIIQLAQARGLPHLYLQTVNLTGGLYSRLGWEPVERFQYRGVETLLMCKTL